MDSARINIQSSMSDKSSDRFYSQFSRYDSKTSSLGKLKVRNILFSFKIKFK